MSIKRKFIMGIKLAAYGKLEYLLEADIHIFGLIVR